MKAVAAVVLTFFLVSASFAHDLGWPREKSNASGTIIYYQPQLDDWKGYRQIDARMAVSIKPKTGQPTVGVVHLQARTDANLDTRNVVLASFKSPPQISPPWIRPTPPQWISCELVTRGNFSSGITRG